MIDDDIRRLAREWRANPCGSVADALGRARCRAMRGVEPMDESGAYRHTSGIQLVHVPDLMLFVGRFPVMVFEWWRVGVAKRRTRGRPVEGFTELHPITCDHQSAVDFLDVIGARLPTSDEWRHVMLGPPSPCDHRYALTTLYRTEIDGMRTVVSCDQCGMSDPPKMRFRTHPWQSLSPVDRIELSPHDWMPIARDQTGANHRGLPRASGTWPVVFQDSLAPVRKAATWCGAQDVAHVRERVTVDGGSSVVGGSWLRSWSPEKDYIGDNMGDVGFRIAVDAGGPR